MEIILFLALVGYIGKTIGMDLPFAVRGVTPPGHEMRMAKFAAKQARGGVTRPPRGGATGRYMAGVWSDALDWRTEKRQGRRQVKAVHQAGRVDRRVARAREKVAAKADRPRTVRPFPSAEPSVEDRRPDGQVPSVRPLVRPADDYPQPVGPKPDLPGDGYEAGYFDKLNGWTDAEHPESADYLSGWDDAAARRAPRDGESYQRWVQRHSLFDLHPVRTADQAEITIHHNDGTSSKYWTRDPDEFAGWQAEADRQANAYEIRDYEIHPDPSRDQDDLATVHPIGGSMSAETTAPSGEILTLPDAIRFTEQMIAAASKLASVGQESMDSLQALGMSGPLIGKLTTACEGLTAAGAAYQEARNELSKHVDAAEAVSLLGQDAADRTSFYNTGA